MNTNLEYIILGKKLKKFREAAGMSLSDAAKKAGVSSPFLSMVENGKSGVSYKSLHAILRVYGKNFDDISEKSEGGDGITVRAVTAPTIAYDNNTLLRAFSSSNNGIYVGGFHLLIDVGGHNSYDQHEGLEFCSVTEGIAELHLEYDDGTVKTIELEKGDTTIYDSGTKHCWYNTGDVIATILIIEIKKN